MAKDVGQQMLALRAGDGFDAVVQFTPGTELGDWQPTPAANAPALLPGWGAVTPFAMTSGSQFSPDDIPEFSSTEYAAAFNQVKELGSATSATRTADQTNIALFWANGGGDGHASRPSEHGGADRRAKPRGTRFPKTPGCSRP